MKLISPPMLSKYKLLMENTQEIIIFFDSSGRITDCSTNAANELGYREDIFSVLISDIFKKVFHYEESSLKIDPNFIKSFQETTAYCKNQTCISVELKVSTIRRNKKEIGICTAINNTEEKESLREISNLKEELKHYNGISSELVARIAHELRTPVNGIMGFSNNLSDMELGPDQAEAVNIIKRCCNNMNIIINDLMDYAKISNNKLIIEQREFSFSGMIQNVIDMNLVHVNEKGLKLTLNIANDIPDKVIGDEHRLSQVLNNLFSNAIKFTSDGQINLEIIKIVQTDQYIELFFMLIDTGIGISREEKDKLFKSFSQVDSSITRRFGGTGLGLSICKRLVEAMHGTIEVDSEKNKGSTFSFSVRLGLPRATEVVYYDSHDKFPNLNLCKVIADSKEKYYEQKNEISDIDYIKRMLQDISLQDKEDNAVSMKKALIFMNELLEKLVICIEMENWEKSEELASSIKNLIPKDHTVNSKIIFRLLLAVRKENHDDSLKIINEIKLRMLLEK